MFFKLESLLHNSLRRSGSYKQVKSTQLLEIVRVVFVETFGEEITKRITFRSIENRFLILSCESSVIAQEIKLQEQKLIQEIHTAAHSTNALEGIRFVS